MSDEPAKISDAFRRMADAIDHNAERSKFGGAVVIIPPANGGDSIETLLLDSGGDPVQFWNVLNFKIKSSLDTLEAKQKNPFGGR